MSQTNVTSVVPDIQLDASDDLKVISWPPWQTFRRLLGYAFVSYQEPLSPRYPRVLIIDNGYDLSNKVEDHINDPDEGSLTYRLPGLRGRG